MAADSKPAPDKNISRYIMLSLYEKINRVFGVQVNESLRSDYSDAITRVDGKNSVRAVTRSFIRPTSLALGENTYRSQPLAKHRFPNQCGRSTRW